MVAIKDAGASLELVAIMCVEYWKLAQATQKAIELIPEGNGRKLAGQVKYSQRQLDTLLDQLGLSLVEFEGENFHAGISASADNAEDFDDEAVLVVSKTLEPTILADMKIVRTGRVLVEPAAAKKD